MRSRTWRTVATFAGMLAMLCAAAVTAAEVERLPAANSAPTVEQRVGVVTVGFNRFQTSRLIDQVQVNERQAGQIQSFGATDGSVIVESGSSGSGEFVVPEQAQHGAPRLAPAGSKRGGLTRPITGPEPLPPGALPGTPVPNPGIPPSDLPAYTGRQCDVPPDADQFLVTGYPNYFCPPVPNEWYDGCRWFFTADVIALKRDQVHDVPLATYANSSNVVLGTRLQDFPFRAGMRLRAGYSVTPVCRIEGLYFGLANWTESDSVRDNSANAIGGTGNIQSVLSNFGRPTIPGVDYNDFAAFDYHSSLDNVELNLRHRFWTPPWLEASFLFGARYINIREQLNLSTASGPPVVATNRVATSTTNNLLGLQIGGIVNVPFDDDWWIQLEVKGALCQNNGSQQTTYHTTSSGAAQLFTTGKSGPSTAVVGDLTLTFNYQLTQHIATRIGYQAVSIDGLALASQNVERNISNITLGPGNLANRGLVIYHGPNAGVTVTW